MRRPLRIWWKSHRKRISKWKLQLSAVCQDLCPSWTFFKIAWSPPKSTNSVALTMKLIILETYVICSTSGTTSTSKETELSHMSVYNSVTLIAEIHMIEVSLWMLTIRWHYRLTVMIEIILSNAKWIIIPEAIIDDEIEMCKIIRKYGMSFMK